MDGLRLILLAIGAVILALIYWMGTRGRRSARSRELEEAPAPETEGVSLSARTLSEEPSPEEVERSWKGLDPARREADGAAVSHDVMPEGDPPGDGGPALPGAESRDGQSTAAAAETDDRGEEMIVVVHVAAPRGRRLSGRDLIPALEEAGLEYGEMQIFHYRDEHGRAVFSAASMVKPGTLEPERMEEIATPGVSFFLRLPGPRDGVTAFDEMLTAATRVAARLDGELLDESRSVLTNQTAQHTRERIQLAALRAMQAPGTS